MSPNDGRQPPRFAPEEPERTPPSVDDDEGLFVGPGGEPLPDLPRWRTLLADRRRLALLALLPLVVVGVLLLISTAFGDGALVDAASEADGRWFFVCAVGEIVAYMGYVVVFRVAASADDGPRLSRRNSLHVVFAALGATRLLAAGGAGGLAVFYWALRKSGSTAQGALVRVLGMNVFLFVMFGALGWLAALVLFLGSENPAPLVIVVPWLVGAPTLVVLLLIVSGRRGRTRRELSDRWPEWLRTGLASVVPGIGLGTRLVARAGNRRRVIPGGALYWAGDITCLWAGLMAFGVELPIAAVVLGYATGYLATLLPLPTGAEGASEAATIVALVALGAPLAPTLLGVLVFRLFSFWAPTIPAILTLPTLPALGRRLEQRRLEAAPAMAAAPVEAEVEAEVERF